MGGNASKVLAKIDKANTNCDAEITKLFNKLDKDKTGYLEGEEYQSFLEMATEYMHKDLQKMGNDYDMETVRTWVKEWLDPNKDGRISKAEMLANLKAVLDSGE